MEGLIKPKQYDWKDSNLALFGSDVENQVKKESAECEPAWRKAGQEFGLQIWRIVKFKVTEWPKSEYGKFYNGDSYIILNTYQEEGSDQLLYDVHFWIGKYSTQDEYGTAAYKTVELDTYLNDVPIQHREVQDHESALFRSYFPTVTILEGGADSGFRKVKPEEYRPRLLHFHGDKHGVRVREVPRCRSRIDSTDVYILDLGLRLIQWNGRGSNKDERFQALSYSKQLASERGGKPKVETVDEGSDAREFDRYLDKENETEEEFLAADKTPELYRLSDASGTMSFKLEKRGNVSRSDFDSNDVFIFDTKSELFVWIGCDTTEAERKNAMVYAHRYLMGTDHPMLPVSCVSENGRQAPAFVSALSS
ncbi:hypothetical protein C0Q70_14907 [Pomacea canaliculata]|uniref:Actin-modulator n=1 Tax=Pomacea canaliculata TaxID=400727 RepID=A0A2T7NTD6_POMCA|nr:gelsolin-like protein 2 [Pomacea canaliculata]XP_025106311.1 gelsolin-like protein 2 [Pomacea canaliculata]PVD24424.1 hypothetical protein C0Q70_14907 [Pomacea canaliculata]